MWRTEGTCPHLLLLGAVRELELELATASAVDLEVKRLDAAIERSRDWEEKGA